MRGREGNWEAREAGEIPPSRYSDGGRHFPSRGGRFDRGGGRGSTSSRGRDGRGGRGDPGHHRGFAGRGRRDDAPPFRGGRARGRGPPSRGGRMGFSDNRGGRGGRDGRGRIDNRNPRFNDHPRSSALEDRREGPHDNAPLDRFHREDRDYSNGAANTGRDERPEPAPVQAFPQRPRAPSNGSEGEILSESELTPPPPDNHGANSYAAGPPPAAIRVDHVGRTSPDQRWGDRRNFQSDQDGRPSATNNDRFRDDPQDRRDDSRNFPSDHGISERPPNSDRFQNNPRNDRRTFNSSQALPDRSPAPDNQRFRAEPSEDRRSFQPAPDNGRFQEGPRESRRNFQSDQSFPERPPSLDNGRFQEGPRESRRNFQSDQSFPERPPDNIRFQAEPRESRRNFHSDQSFPERPQALENGRFQAGRRSFQPDQGSPERPNNGRFQEFQSDQGFPERSSAPDNNRFQEGPGENRRSFQSDQSLPERSSAPDNGRFREGPGESRRRFQTDQGVPERPPAPDNNRFHVDPRDRRRSFQSIVPERQPAPDNGQFQAEPSDVRRSFQSDQGFPERPPALDNDRFQTNRRDFRQNNFQDLPERPPASVNADPQDRNIDCRNFQPDREFFDNTDRFQNDPQHRREDHRSFQSDHGFPERPPAPNNNSFQTDRPPDYQVDRSSAFEADERRIENLPGIRQSDRRFDGPNSRKSLDRSQGNPPFEQPVPNRTSQPDLPSSQVQQEQHGPLVDERPQPQVHRLSRSVPPRESNADVFSRHVDDRDFAPRGGLGPRIHGSRGRGRGGRNYEPTLIPHRAAGPGRGFEGRGIDNPRATGRNFEGRGREPRRAPGTGRSFDGRGRADVAGRSFQDRGPGIGRGSFGGGGSFSGRDQHPQRSFEGRGFLERGERPMGGRMMDGGRAFGARGREPGRGGRGNDRMWNRDGDQFRSISPRSASSEPLSHRGPNPDNATSWRTNDSSRKADFHTMPMEQTTRSYASFAMENEVLQTKVTYSSSFSDIQKQIPPSSLSNTFSPPPVTSRMNISRDKSEESIHPEEDEKLEVSPPKPKPPSPPRPPTPPPEPSAPSGYFLALTRLAEIEAQMEFEYAKLTRLSMKRKLVRAEHDTLVSLPVGRDAFQEDLEKYLHSVKETEDRKEDEPS